MKYLEFLIGIKRKGLTRVNSYFMTEVSMFHLKLNKDKTEFVVLLSKQNVKKTENRLIKAGSSPSPYNFLTELWHCIVI